MSSVLSWPYDTQGGGIPRWVQQDFDGSFKSSPIESLVTRIWRFPNNYVREMWYHCFAITQIIILAYGYLSFFFFLLKWAQSEKDRWLPWAVAIYTNNENLKGAHVELARPRKGEPSLPPIPDVMIPYKLTCTGSIIARQWIATSAQCIPIRNKLPPYENIDRKGGASGNPMKVKREPATSWSPYVRGKLDPYARQKDSYGPQYDTIYTHEKIDWRRSARAQREWHGLEYTVSLHPKKRNSKFDLIPS